MPIISVPKYPVVDPSPNLQKVLFNLNLVDYSKVAAFTTAGYVMGWFSARKPFRGPQSKFLAGIGLIAGLTYASMSSTQRFLGLEANPYEVKRYGIMSADELALRTEQADTPNLNLIDSSANHDDD